MSSGDDSVQILSGDEVAAAILVVDLELTAEQSVELNTTPEDLMVVRRDCPQAVQPLSTILPPTQVAGPSAHDASMVPPIRADEEDLLEEEMPMRRRSPGTYIWEADPAVREYALHGAPIPNLRDEEDEVGSDDEEEMVGGGHGEEAFQTDQARLIAEGSSSQAAPKRKGNVIVPNAVNVTIDGEVNAVGSIMTNRDVARLIDRYSIPMGVAWRLSEPNEVACSYTVPQEVCLFEHMFTWGMRFVSGPEERPLGFQFLATILNNYGLSPGQLTANAFVNVLGFWEFLYGWRGEDTPISKGPFSYFFELKERKKEGRYYFSKRKYMPVISKLKK